MICPARSRQMLGVEDFDWAFESEVETELRQPGAGSAPGGDREASTKDLPAPEGDGFGREARAGRRMKQPRGKVVGGSSAINSFALIYPAASEIDVWAELGNPGWDWEGMKRYFRRFQTLVSPGEKVVEELNLAHNFASGTGDGPIQAMFSYTVTLMHKAWIGAWREVGLENARDPLEGEAIGGGITSVHIDAQTRERSHAGVAYLGDAVRARRNLSVVTGAMASRIEFEKLDGGDAVARSVSYEKDGKIHEIKVRKELILAAGVFGSPQLLELSGIGDARLLSKHGIDVVYDNPAVGENLQDHIRPALSWEATDAADHQPIMSAEEAERLYNEKRTGPWAEMAAYMFSYVPLAPFFTTEEMQQLQTLCHEHLDSDTNDKGEPLSPFERRHNAFIKKSLLSPTEASATAFSTRRPAAPFPMPSLDQGRPITLCAMLSHPLSRGSTHITTANPSTKPEIRFNYYTHPLDLEVHARHMLALQHLARTPSLRALIKPHGARYPPEDLTIKTAKEYIRANATTNYHPCGTCAMMSESLGGVVDERLRVYGTRNVRVVDASVFPIVPRGNIITTVYAVAEKGAEIIAREMGVRGS